MMNTAIMKMASRRTTLYCTRAEKRQKEVDASNRNSAVPTNFFIHFLPACKVEALMICRSLETPSTGVLLTIRSAALREETLTFQVHLARLQEESTINVHVIVVASKTM